jgi:hypothetical protein
MEEDVGEKQQASYQMLDLDGFIFPKRRSSEYSDHPYCACFSNMISRCKKLGLPCGYSRSLEVINKFAEDIGQIP